MNKCNYQNHNQQKPNELVVCICNRPAAAITCRKCGNEFFGRLARRCEQHPNVIQLMDLQECPNRLCHSVDLDMKSIALVSASSDKSSKLRIHPPPPPHKRINFITATKTHSSDVEMRNSTSPTRQQSATENKKMIELNNNNNGGADHDVVRFGDSANGISDDEAW